MEERYSIVTSDICKRFGEKNVLDGINLKIREGEIFGLLGPSGAGKTTLIRILTGQLEQSGGEAFLLEENTRKLAGAVREQTGMMLDEAGLYERLSCYDNLVLFAGIYRLPKSRIGEVLKEVGLTEARKRGVKALSKGMRQRLVLARALLHRPKVLFLDEPSSGLDPSTAKEIHELILKQRERGATVFLTTHNMEEASKLCDNVALLDGGRIVEYGEPKAICRRYNHQDRVKILLRNGETIVLPNDSSSAERISSFFQKGSVESIHSTEPDLETVFLELTGRSLE